MRTEIKSLLARANLYEICEELGVSRVTIWRTLNGSGKSNKKSLDDLAAVIARAKELEIKAAQKIQNLLS